MVKIGPKRIGGFHQAVPGGARPEGAPATRLTTRPGTRSQSKAEAKALLAQGIEMLSEYQTRLAAQDTYGVLVVLQAMDAAGKDGTIRHVMSGVNPQGVQVSSFKIPSTEDLDHDYLWRYQRSPARARQHRDLQSLATTRSSSWSGSIPRSWPTRSCRPQLKRGDIWKRRFREINDWERYLTDQGFRFVKMFLNRARRNSEGGS